MNAKVRAFSAVVILAMAVESAHAQRTVPDVVAGYVLAVNDAPGVRVYSVSGGGMFRGSTSATFETEALRFDWDLSAGLTPWLSQAVAAGAAPSDDVVVLVVDGEGLTLNQRTLKSAYVASIAIPRLKAGSSDPAFATVELNSRSIEYAGGSKQPLGTRTDGASGWVAGNFRVQVEDLPTAGVRMVEPFMWAQPVPDGNRSTQRRKAEAIPMLLRLHIPMADFEAWRKWIEPRIRDRNAAVGSGKKGAIVLFSRDRRTELTIEMDGLVPAGLSFPPAEPGAPAVFEAALHVERIRFGN